MATQYGEGKTLAIAKDAFKGKNPSTMTNTQIIDAIQDAKRRRAIKLEPEQTLKGILNRIEKERKVLHKLNSDFK